MIPIDEVVHFDVITSDPSTGAATDADSAPTFDVFEEATDTPILNDQSMTKRTSLDGNYRGTFTASAANGFEAGKWYSVVVTAIVGEVSGKTVAKNFRVAPAESSAGVPKVDVSHAAGTAWNSGAITANTLASGALTAAKFAAGAFDAVWSVTTRLLTAGTNIVLAKGTGVTGFNDIAATAIVSDGPITTSGGAVSTVTTVGTCTTNTDMRGTDNAYTGTPPTAEENATAVRSELGTELGRIDAAISSRSSHSASDITGGTTVAQAVTSIKGADGDDLKDLSDEIAAVQTEVNKIPRTGETHTYTNDDTEATATVTITESSP